MADIVSLRADTRKQRTSSTKPFSRSRDCRSPRTRLFSQIRPAAQVETWIWTGPSSNSATATIVHLIRTSGSMIPRWATLRTMPAGSCKGTTPKLLLCITTALFSEHSCVVVSHDGSSSYVAKQPTAARRPRFVFMGMACRSTVVHPRTMASTTLHSTAVRQHNTMQLSVWLRFAHSSCLFVNPPSLSHALIPENSILHPASRLACTRS
jgi:hypothetical protein